MIKVICEALPAPACPTYSDYDTNKCKEHGGEPNFFEDSRGCKIFECRFQGTNVTPFVQPPQPVYCPTEEEREKMAEKCRNYGGVPFVRKDFSGCLVLDCKMERVSIQCPSKEEVDEAARGCEEKGGQPIPTYDNRGCRTIDCRPAGETSCRPIPKEAFDRCREEGGEMIVKEENGCLTYAKCVRRGDESRIEFERVEEIPKTSILLSLAFKLEQLKIEFDKLARQTEDIANYYTSAAEPGEAERFRKVSSMFDGAKQRIDEIKTKMRERITSLTREDIAEFKHDLKYVREVVIQDILYVMLSVEGAPAISKEGCGSDGFCFNKALRTCEKTKFYPEGAKGPEVIIEGLEDKNCIIKASMQADGKTYDMVCKYPNYVMGMRGPEELLPYCSGSMVEMIKMYSPQPVRPVR